MWAASLKGRQHAETQVHNVARRADDAPWRSFSFVHSVFHLSSFKSPGLSEVVLKCPISMVTIPVVAPAARGRAFGLKRKKTKSRFWGQRKQPKSAAKKPTKKDKEGLPVTYMKWPVLSPAFLFEAIVKAEAWELVAAPKWCWWRDFWSPAMSEDWASNHPVYDLSLEDRKKSVACSFHGDEGQGKRSRNVLILSWSSIAITGPSEYCKFPFAVSCLASYVSPTNTESQPEL